VEDSLVLFFLTRHSYYYLGYHTYDLGYTMNGCLTGLVAITAGCATVETWAAVLIGMVAGWVYLLGSKLLIKYRIDDAVDAIPVHCVGGAWGVIATGLFTQPELLLAAYGQDENVGWFYEWGRGSGNFTLIGIQLIGVAFIFGWVVVVMGTYFYVLNFFGWLRIDPLEEEVGMDISRHKGSAYEMSMGVPKDSDVQQLEAKRLSLYEDRSVSHRGKRRKSGSEGNASSDAGETTDAKEVEAPSEDQA
jgi:Amt family ammonium transporter